MKYCLYRRLGLIVLVAGLSIGAVVGQEHSPASASAQSQPSAQQAQPANPDAAASSELAAESEQAVHAEEGEVHEENAQFKYSAMVAKLGSFVGIGPHGMYWVSMALNFIFLGLFFWMLLRSKLPQMFRERTSTIQQALKEARAASAEASRRLGDIEARLSKLDAAVNEIRVEAEREAAAEEGRIKSTAEEDKRKIVEAAESEIAAITRSARHGLKSFAASLAVDIAARKIQVDDNTDQALVRQFVGHLGKDGK